MTVSLKEDQLVLISEDDGSLPLGASSPLGLYYHDTQFLSGYKLRVNGSEPLLLSGQGRKPRVVRIRKPDASLW